MQLSQLANCGQGGRNHSRNLHRLIHRTGRTLPVTITTVPTPIRILKGKPKVHTCNYPTMMLSSWAKQLFSTGGQFLLSGYTIDDVRYRGVFKDFWTQYRQVEPELDFYSRDFEWETAIPFSFHGDEGRGKLKRPIMIEAYQPLITHRGPEFTNSSGTLVLFTATETPIVMIISILSYVESCSILIYVDILPKPKAPSFVSQAQLHHTSAVCRRAERVLCLANTGSFAPGTCRGLVEAVRGGLDSVLGCIMQFCIYITCSGQGLVGRDP